MGNYVFKKNTKKISEFFFRKIIFPIFFLYFKIPHTIWGLPAKIWGGLGTIRTNSTKRLSQLIIVYTYRVSHNTWDYKTRWGGYLTTT
jgi:hypothetical protein